MKTPVNPTFHYMWGFQGCSLHGLVNLMETGEDLDQPVLFNIAAVYCVDSLVPMDVLFVTIALIGLSKCTV